MTTVKSRPSRLLVLLIVALSTMGVLGVATPARAAVARSAIYGGGPFYNDGQAVMDTLRSSGFTTVILWSIHVRDNGDLWYNDDLIVSNGSYVGDAGWPARLATLKQAPTSVDRIEISVGSAGPNDWGTIATLVNSGGTGPDSILYRNFSALKAATGADAINDESIRSAKPNGSCAKGAAPGRIWRSRCRCSWPITWASCSCRCATRQTS